MHLAGVCLAAMRSIARYDEHVTPQQILFVHRSTQLLENLRQIFEERGHEVLTACDAGEACKLLDEDRVALISLSVDPSDAGLQTFLEYVTEHAPTTPLLAEIATPNDLVLIADGPPCLHVVVAPVLSTVQRVTLIERLVPPAAGRPGRSDLQSDQRALGEQP
jgi:hypothetical protein